MRKCNFIAILLLLCRTTTFSQSFFDSFRLDSLKQVLLLVKDTQRVNTLNLLAGKYLYPVRTQNISEASQTLAQHYTEEALRLATQLQYTKGIGNALLNKGNLMISKENFSSSLSFLKDAMPLLRQAGDRYAIAGCMESTAFCFHAIGNNKTAILYYDSAQILFRRVGDLSKAAYNMAWIGHCYYDLGNYVEAYKVGQAAYELTKRTDTLLQTFTLAHLSNLYLGAGLPEVTIQYLRRILLLHPELGKKQAVASWPLSWALERGGQAFLQLNQVDSAINIARFLKIPFEKQDVTNHLFYGQLYTAQHDYKKALPHFKRGFELSKQTARLISRASHAEALGRTYLHLKQYDNAIYYAEEGFAVAKTIHALLEMKNAAGTLTDIYDKSGLYAKAYYYSKLYKSISDSVAPEEYKRKLALLQIQNELAIERQQAQLLVKDNQIKQQQLKNETFVRNMLIAAIFTFFVLGFFVLRNIYLKRKNEANLRKIAENDLRLQKLESEKIKMELQQRAAELEMQALRAQMNPHFIFNCLSSINKFILKNESQSASDYLTKFSRLIRMVLNHSKEPLVSLEEELEMLRLYLELERMRFRYSFDYNIHFKNEVEADCIFIPPLLLQPFAENAIWHGLMHKQGHGQLEIELGIDGNKLTCVINDNGVGRDRAASLKSKSAEKYKSMGLQLTAERLALLNHDLDEPTTFAIEDISGPQGTAAGTRVVLQLKYKDLTELSLLSQS